MQGSRREQPGMVVPGLSQQDKEEIKPGGTESPPPLFLSCRKGLSAVYRVLAELMAYSSSQILFSSIATFWGKILQLRVLTDFWISFFRRAPTATFHDSKHNIVHVHFDATRGWLLTSGTDKVIKVGASNVL